MANYQQGNYMYVIPTYYDPMSFSEMDRLFQVISEGNKQAAENYIQLADNADAFKYLDDTLPETSKARGIYDRYAGDLNKLSKDFLENGVGPTNMQGYLNLRRRYNSEIGKLVKADERLQKELETRRNVTLKDPTMLYSTENLTIDDFLDKGTPNLYSISGQDLYKMGAETGVAESARIFSDPKLMALGEQYNIIRQTAGISPEQIQQLRNNFDSDPNFKKAVDDILYRTGVTNNFTDQNSYNYKAARQSVIDGILNGATFKQADNIQQNPDYISPKQQVLYEKQMAALNRGGSGSLSSSGSSDDSNRVPAYEEGYLYYKSRGGIRQKAIKKGESDYVDALEHAGEIHVDKTIDEGTGNITYKLKGRHSDKDGNPKETTYVTFTLDKNGNFSQPTVTGNINSADFGTDFGTSGLFWIGNYDKEWDNPNLAALANEIQDIIKREGSSNAYNNYKFYLEPDNAGWKNDNDAGGYWIEPKSRSLKTTANDEDPTYDPLTLQKLAGGASE